MRILPQKKRGFLSLDGIHFYVGNDTLLGCRHLQTGNPYSRVITEGSGGGFQQLAKERRPTNHRREEERNFAVTRFISPNLVYSCLIYHGVTTVSMSFLEFKRAPIVLICIASSLMF